MPQRYTVTDLGPDVDLETEDLRLADGTRLTQEVADGLVAEIRSKAGRPSLGRAGTRSPSIAFRLPADLRDKAERLAEQEGKSLSELAREALETRLRAS